LEVAARPPLLTPNFFVRKTVAGRWSFVYAKTLNLPRISQMNAD